MLSPSQILFCLTLPLGIALFWQDYLSGVISILFENIPDDAPRVRLAQGLVIGIVLNESFPAPIEAFLGLPYALPPVEELRFARAVKIPDSEVKVFNARRNGPGCPGKALVAVKAGPKSEDCMTLNVFRQTGIKNGVKVPVMVYIHGGGYNRWSSEVHDTASMVAWSEKPFIGVSFNYRLGALGFLNSEVTFEQGLANIGLHDQAFVLQWVQDNIKDFGGDKNDVTLMGLSAGAHSIGHHILNYKEGVQPPFHKAIIESGAATSRAIHKYDALLQEDQFAAFINRAGCYGYSKPQIIPCLRFQSARRISKASEAVFDLYKDNLRWAFQPVIDEDLIRGRPIDIWRSGKYNKVPILTGHNTNEGTLYVPSNMNTAKEFREFWHTLLPHYDDNDLNAIEALYSDPATERDSPYTDTRDLSTIKAGPQFKRIEAAYAHHAYTCPVRQTAEIVAASTTNPPVWVYHWAVNTTLKGGANHADNMHYGVFSHDIASISEAQREISGAYHAYLTSFITAGDPNAVGGRFKERPRWEAYKPDTKAVMTFGRENDERAGGEEIGTAAELRGSDWIEKECSFWWKKSEHTED